MDMTAWISTGINGALLVGFFVAKRWIETDVQKRVEQGALADAERAHQGQAHRRRGLVAPQVEVAAHALAFGRRLSLRAGRPRRQLRRRPLPQARVRQDVLVDGPDAVTQRGKLGQ